MVRDVFISHVEEDAELALAIAGGLEEQGFSTWYYERDSIPGPSYLTQVCEAVDASTAVVVVISPDSLSSSQMTVEVVRAHESRKRFVPVLRGISHAEFQQRQPEWRAAIGASASVSAGAEGAAALVPRIAAGLRSMGVPTSGGAANATEMAPAPIAATASPTAPAAPQGDPALAQTPATHTRRAQERARWAERRERRGIRRAETATPRRLRPWQVCAAIGLVAAVVVGIGLGIRGCSPHSSGSAGVSLSPAPGVPATPNAKARETSTSPARLSKDLAKALVQLPAGTEWPEGAVVNEKDGSVLVLVPAGEATFGSPDGEGDLDEHPQFRANLPGYYIGVTEVTNAQYKGFVDATGRVAPPHWSGGQGPSDLANHPVVNADWGDAQAYCDWAGLRLPSELEWERAARGTEGRTYPWGAAWDASRCRCAENCGPGTTAPVGSYPSGASPCGALDMAGNLMEWCEDWFDSQAYARYAQGGLAPPATGKSRALRGG